MRGIVPHAGDIYLFNDIPPHEPHLHASSSPIPRVQPIPVKAVARHDVVTQSVLQYAVTNHTLGAVVMKNFKHHLQLRRFQLS